MVSTPLKNMSQNGLFPQVGVKTKNLWNHHQAWYYTFHKILVASSVGLSLEIRLYLPTSSPIFTPPRWSWIDAILWEEKATSQRDDVPFSMPKWDKKPSENPQCLGMSGVQPIPKSLKNYLCLMTKCFPCWWTFSFIWASGHLGKNHLVRL